MAIDVPGDWFEYFLYYGRNHHASSIVHFCKRLTIWRCYLLDPISIWLRMRVSSAIWQEIFSDNESSLIFFVPVISGVQVEAEEVFTPITRNAPKTNAPKKIPRYFFCIFFFVIYLGLLKIISVCASTNKFKF